MHFILGEDHLYCPKDEFPVIDRSPFYAGFIVSLFVMCRLGMRDFDLHFCQSGIDTAVGSVQWVISVFIRG